MPAVNPEILVWARETAGYTRRAAAERVGLGRAHGMSGETRLWALEHGQEEPTRAQLVKFAKCYRRPLITFYMAAPPRKGERGEDFRTLPEQRPSESEALLDALLRNVRARQSIVRSVLEDDEDVEPLEFVGSRRMSEGVPGLLQAMVTTLDLNLDDFRDQSSPREGFELLRSRAEAAGVFVLLMGDLGSHHTALEVETFRGFALSDAIAPFVIINPLDSRSAWAFTLLHELAHIWLGTTGVSGPYAESRIERMCNDVASDFLLPTAELPEVDVATGTGFDVSVRRIEAFARVRHLSRSMVAYKLYRCDYINKEAWGLLRTEFRGQWLDARRRRRQIGGPNYYELRRQRMGRGLVGLVQRAVREGTLSPSKAGKVLGVKATNVEKLLSQPMGAVG